ncbi:MAG: MerR family transcriptional regulator [Parvularculaceae bacterium]|nr:MerR family transcriptional regulator [Parvularculaceae bacterium]
MALAKSAEAFRTISEASLEIDVPQHVLRHWEEAFGQIRPMRRAGGRRYYRPVDLDVLRGVRALLYEARYSTKGVQKIFREHGIKYVAELGRLAAAGQPLNIAPLVSDDADDRETEALAPRSAPSSGDLSMTAETRARLEVILQRLERAERALDDAVVAIEAIEFGDRG